MRKLFEEAAKASYCVCAVGATVAIGGTGSALIMLATESVELATFFAKAASAGMDGFIWAGVTGLTFDAGSYLLGSKTQGPGNNP